MGLLARFTKEIHCTIWAWVLGELSHDERGSSLEGSRPEEVKWDFRTLSGPEEEGL